jgi:hypothetical protein
MVSDVEVIVFHTCKKQASFVSAVPSFIYISAMLHLRMPPSVG